LGNHLDTLTISYQKTGYQIESLKIGELKNEKGRIQAAGFTLLGRDIIFISHGFQAVDMLVFIADSVTSGQRTGKDDILKFFCG